MNLVVLALGALVLLVSAAGIVRPAVLRGMVEYFTMGNRLYAAVFIRIGAGMLLILAAEATRVPQLTTGLGVLFVLAGAGILIAGIPNVIRFAYWWLSKPNLWWRLALLFGVGLGALLIWLAWP